jgi:thiamine kinase-like enzyme
MNKDNLMQLANHFNIGNMNQNPHRVYGGLLHIMWRFDTDKGSYAIKQLSKDINLTDERIIKNYELSERIASRFSALDMPAVPAIEKTGKCLFMIDGTGFLVYPWVEAKALDQHTVSELHAIKIAEIVAKMHRLNLEEPEITQPEFYTHTQEKIIALIDKTKQFDCPFAKNLQENKNHLLAANETYQSSISTLRKQLIVSHGDLDQKNVLWDNHGNPILIDWESVCKINPTYDIINTAFYWSGITSHFDEVLFIKMIDAYQKSSGLINKEHVVAACYGAFSWIGWLAYNIERSCVEGESEQKTLGIEQVNQTLATILRLQSIMPELIKLLQKDYA